jgi:hypothetical protein
LPFLRRKLPHPTLCRIDMKKKKKKNKIKTKISAAMIKKMAFDCETIIAASAKADFNLSPVFKRNIAFRKAWDRGRLLRNIAGQASTAATVPEAEQSLELEKGSLSELIERDTEVGDVWRQRRLILIAEIKSALIKLAKEGKLSALKQIEAILRNELASGRMDLNHIPIKQMVEITGKTRQTIHDWYTRFGLTRNSDRTFDLAVFIRWYEDFVTKKTASPEGSPRDPLRTLKEKRLQMDLQRESGDLLGRSEVLAGLLARQQNLINNLNPSKAEELGSTCANKPPEKITEIINNFFFQVLRNQCNVPEQLRLPPEIADKFGEILNLIRPEGQ